MEEVEEVEGEQGSQEQQGKKEKENQLVSFGAPTSTDPRPSRLQIDPWVQPEGLKQPLDLRTPR